MKIVYCIYQLGVGGGVERVLTNKVNYLVEQGHEVAILTCLPLKQAPMYGIDERVQIKSFTIDYASDWQYGIAKRFINTIAKMYQHYKVVRRFLQEEFKADIVVTTHAYEMAFLPLIKDGSKKVLELHSSAQMYEMQRQERGGWQMGLLVRLLNLRDTWVNKLFDAVGCLTHEDYELRGKPSNMVVIPNMLPFTSDTPSDCKSKVALAVGNCTPQKNFPELVEIWGQIAPKYPDWKLKIVGGGYQKKALAEKIQSMGLSESILLGESTANVQPYYQESSIYVMTSIFEGLPMVLLEAQTMGLPIVSYATPCGPRDIIAEGQTGFVIPMGDRDQFITKLELLMENEALRQEMGRAAQEASETYSIPKVMTLWLDLFERLISNNSPK